MFEGFYASLIIMFTGAFVFLHVADTSSFKHHLKSFRLTSVSAYDEHDELPRKQVRVGRVAVQTLCFPLNHASLVRPNFVFGPTRKTKSLRLHVRFSNYTKIYFAAGAYSAFSRP